MLGVPYLYEAGKKKMIVGDFETRSHADLRKVGASVYSEHPTTDVVCFCWAVNAKLIEEWVPTLFGGESDECPPSLCAAIEEGHLFEAHSVPFEYSHWNNIMVPRYKWPEIPDDRWRDSMATACYYALPPALDKLCKVLGLPGKDPAGTRLISKYSKLHLKTAREDIPPEEVRRYVDYCKVDVDQERSVGNILGELPDEELLVWQHDFMVNRRGIYLDLGGIAAAASIVDQRSESLASEFREITDLNPGQREKIIGWCAGEGLELENLQAEYLEGILGAEEERHPDDLDSRPELPSNCRRALEIRLQHSKASTRKLDAMARQRGSDGRARFQTRYHGAVTGRNTATGFQVLNMSRGFDDVEPDQLVRDIRRGSATWLDAVYGDAMDAVGKSVRHWVTAEPGNRIMAGDFTAIEAIILACLAGEDWKREAFRNHELIYEKTGAFIHGLSSITKESHPQERQDGKVCELMCGFQGSIGGWRNFDKSDRHSDEAVLEFVSAWRRMHPAITAFWEGLQGAAELAVRQPGTYIEGNRLPPIPVTLPAPAPYNLQNGITSYRDIGFEMVDGWLTMILPNGKRLWYRDPQMRWAMPPWHQPKKEEECATGECDCTSRPQLTYMSWKNGQWRRVPTYGGKLTENAVQATSRELLKPAERRIEAAGYPVVLSAYDEIICEVPEGYGTEEEFRSLMEELPEWAEGWPVYAKVWQGERYKK